MARETQIEAGNRLHNRRRRCSHRQAALEARLAKLPELEQREAAIVHASADLVRREAELRIGLERLAQVQEREAALAARQTHVDESEMVYARRATELATGLERLADMEEREVAFLAPRGRTARTEDTESSMRSRGQATASAVSQRCRHREIALAAREAEVLAREQLLRTQGEREASSYTARSHDLDRREVESSPRAKQSCTVLSLR